MSRRDDRAWQPVPACIHQLPRLNARRFQISAQRVVRALDDADQIDAHSSGNHAAGFQKEGATRDHEIACEVYADITGFKRRLRDRSNYHIADLGHDFPDGCDVKAGTSINVEKHKLHLGDGAVRLYAFIPTRLTPSDRWKDWKGHLAAAVEARRLVECSWAHVVVPIKPRTPFWTVDLVKLRRFLADEAPNRCMVCGQGVDTGSLFEKPEEDQKLQRGGSINRLIESRGFIERMRVLLGPDGGTDGSR